MLKLEIVTPEKRVLDADVDSVTVPTASGETGILPQHAPMVSALKPGVLIYTQKGQAERIAIAGGFVEVSENAVSVLADTADTAEDLKADDERAALQDAERRAAGIMSVEDADAARDQVEAVQARLKVASGK